MATTEPIRNKKQFKALAEYFLRKGQLRNYTMVIMGTYTALRISDLLRLKWSDVYDEERQIFFSHVTIIEHKTGKTKTLALNAQIIGALRQSVEYKLGELSIRQPMRLELLVKLPVILCEKPGDIMRGQAVPCPQLSLWKCITIAIIRLQSVILEWPRTIWIRLIWKWS